LHPGFIKSFTSDSTDKGIDIQVTFPPETMEPLEKENVNGINGLEKILKLTCTVSTNNMHAFDHHCKLRKYSKVIEIIDDFYEVRLIAYEKRKQHLLQELNSQLLVVTNKAKYIQYVLDDVIDLRKKKMKDILNLLHRHQLAKYDDSYHYLVKMTMITRYFFFKQILF
jgi:DNA topoisomerase-2